jgi:ribonuclease HI
MRVTCCRGRSGNHLGELTSGEPATITNRIELQAAISALESLKEPCEVRVVTDSEYRRGGITGWLPRRIANHWRTADWKAVKNDHLWRQLEEATSRHRVTRQWLKGHVGHLEDERCDQLAAAEIAKVRRTFTAQQLAALGEACIAQCLCMKGTRTRRQGRVPPRPKSSTKAGTRWNASLPARAYAPCLQNPSHAYALCIASRDLNRNQGNLF